MQPFHSSFNQVSTFIPLNVSSMFEPLKVEAYLNVDDEDCLRCDSFLNLINEQINQNKPYTLALLQDVGSSFTFCFDAIELNKWTENNWTNPQNRNIISRIFYFSISSYSISTYLGSKEWNKIMVPPIENKFLASTDKQFVKIDGIDNVMNLKPFLKACVFVDTKESVYHIQFSKTKISFFELLKSQEKNNLPYVFAVTQDVDSLNLSYFDGAEFNVWSRENSINPLTGKKIANAFYCMIPPNLTKNQSVNFKYLGDFKEEGDKKIFVDAYILALKGNPVLQYFIGANYKLGKNVIQDFEQAVIWLKLAAENEYPDALFELGVCYNDGMGVKKDMKKAVTLWRRAATYKHVEAHYHLGLNLWEGKGTEKDGQIATFCFHVAANLGHLGAKDKLNQWEKEASDKEKGQVYCLLAIDGLENGQDENGPKWFNLAIKMKNPYAIFLSARCAFLENESNSKEKLLVFTKLDNMPNFEEVMKYDKFFLSKKQNQIDLDNAERYFELATIFYDFGDKTLDADKIIKWFKLAANKGHLGAQFNLGIFYYKGYCVKKDSKEAIKWLKLAAKQGEKNAINVLSQIQNRK